MSFTLTNFSVSFLMSSQIVESNHLYTNRENRKNSSEAKTILLILERLINFASKKLRHLITWKTWLKIEAIWWFKMID